MEAFALFNQRQLEIIDLLQTEDKVSVSELTQRFGVSLVTVRQDLKKLEDQGVQADPRRGDPRGQRIRHLHPGCGTTTSRSSASPSGRPPWSVTGRLSCGDRFHLFLAGQGAGLQAGVTVITNSVFLCNFVRRSPALDVVLLGGSFQHDAEANVGP